MSLMAVFIFYGNGPGLFNAVEKWPQVLFVFGIWTVQLIGSPICLKHYDYRPLEWIWRVLMHWKVQPFRKTA